MWYINGSSLEGLQNFLRWYAYSAMGHGSAPNFAICDRDRWNLQELGSIRFWEEISFNVVNSSYLPILALAIHWALPQKFLFFLQNGKIMILCWNLRYSLSPQACVLVTYYLIMRLCPISFVNAEDLHEDAVICSTHLHVNKKRLHLESETPNHFHKYHPFKVKVRSNIYRIEKPKGNPRQDQLQGSLFLVLNLLQRSQTSAGAWLPGLCTTILEYLMGNQSISLWLLGNWYELIDWAKIWQS